MFAVGQTNNGRERCFVTDTTLTLYCRVAYEMDSFRENKPRVILEPLPIKVQFTRCFVTKYTSLCFVTVVSTDAKIFRYLKYEHPS